MRRLRQNLALGRSAMRLLVGTRCRCGSFFRSATLRPLVLGAVLAALLCSNAASQEPAFPLEPPIMSPILAGAGLGVLGFTAGAASGWALDDTSCEGSGEYICVPWGAFFGAVALGSFGASVGAHRGNRRRGSLGRVLLISYATWAAGMGVVFLAGDGSANELAAGTLILLPFLQFAATVSSERITGRANDRRSRAQSRVGLFVSPTMSGRTALGLKLTF